MLSLDTRDFSALYKTTTIIADPSNNHRVFDNCPGSPRLSSLKITHILLSNRYLIYEVEDFDNYIIYDFLHKQLLPDRPKITSLINKGTEESSFNYRTTWHGEGKLILYDPKGVCNLWDIEKNQVFYVGFGVRIIDY